jgi:ribonuclease P protein subunit POP4
MITITPQNLIRHELVGLEVEIANSLHGDLKGIKGRVVDETKNTLTIEDGDGEEKIIPKGSATFKFTLPDGVTIEIEGKIIVSRPEDRIKKRFRKYW